MPPQGYCCCDPIPEEWMEGLPDRVKGLERLGREVKRKTVKGIERLGFEDWTEVPADDKLKRR